MLELAFEIVLPIVLGIIVGYILGINYHNNIFIVIGFFIGILVSFSRIVKFIKNYNKRK